MPPIKFEDRTAPDYSEELDRDFTEDEIADATEQARDLILDWFDDIQDNKGPVEGSVTSYAYYLASKAFVLMWKAREKKLVEKEQT